MRMVISVGSWWMRADQLSKDVVCCQSSLLLRCSRWTTPDKEQTEVLTQSKKFFQGHEQENSATGKGEEIAARLWRRCVAPLQSPVCFRSAFVVKRRVIRRDPIGWLVVRRATVPEAHYYYFSLGTAFLGLLLLHTIFHLTASSGTPSSASSPFPLTTQHNGQGLFQRR